MSLATVKLKTLSQRVSGKIARMARREGLRLHRLFHQTALSDAGFVQALSHVSSLRDFTKALKQETPCSILNPHLRPEIVGLLDEYFPQCRSQTTTAADLACEHIFDLLGSGPVCLGQKIPWHSDFKTGFSWKADDYYADIRPAPPPGGPDIKVPWELSRCQHFITLGQAFWFTQDERYAREFVVQIEDWLFHNPWPWGVNWACTMDVAIRAVNWLTGYHFLQSSTCLTDEFKIPLFKSLLLHGRHIRRNLENRGSHPNNHYLADLVGLVYLGVLCPFFQESLEWQQFACRELWGEMFKQTLEDGASFEGSTAYHRLAVELFLFAILLCRGNNLPIPADVMQRLEKMIEYVIHYSHPDGTVPMIGDADNGRLFRLRIWDEAEREWLDHRYLLAIGAVLFERPDFAASAADQWQEAIWLFGEAALRSKVQAGAGAGRLEGNPAAGFSPSGLYAMRHGSSCGLLIARPPNKQLAPGHVHCDSLSLTIFLLGIPFLIDPGTYAYTGDYAARNFFRSTESHNTVRVDQAEVIRFSSDNLFGILDPPCCVVHQRHTDGNYDFLEASHAGYAYLPHPVLHRRQVLFDKKLQVWFVCDTVTGSGRHEMEWFWHCAVGFKVQCDGSRFLCEHQATRNRIQVEFPGSHSAQLSVEDRWISSSYGSRHSSPCLRIETTSPLPFELMTLIAPMGVHCSLQSYMNIIQDYRSRKASN